MRGCDGGLAVVALRGSEINEFYYWFKFSVNMQFCVMLLCCKTFNLLCEINIVISFKGTTLI